MSALYDGLPRTVKPLVDHARKTHKNCHEKACMGYNRSMAKSSVSFVEGIHISFGDAATRRGLEQWYLVGTVEGEPFYLHYLGMGATNWAAKGQLTPTLRKRILAQFKKEVRGQKQPWLQEFETDLFATGSSPVQNAVTRAVIEFHKTAWRDRMLDDRDEDYIALRVPYADKDLAQAAGAQWRADKKIWVIHKKLDSGAVAQWMI